MPSKYPHCEGDPDGMATALQLAARSDVPRGLLLSMRTGRAAGLAITASVIALAVSLLMSTSAQASPADSGTSARVVDGDTIVAAVGATEERVRFLNVDTPEVGTCLADKATSFTTRALPAGQSIVLR